MIAKEFVPLAHDPADRRMIAGVKAEEQMAFYLKRAFGSGELKDVLVFNGLRLANDASDDFAQIDHLVFWRRGIILVESKSVSTRVKVNARGEWERLWGDSWQGMPSPVQQAKLQAEFLKALLNEHNRELRRKVPLSSKHWAFNICPFDTIVAISDSGSIDRDGADFPEVVKADQVVDRIKQIFKKHAWGMFNPNPLSDDGMEKFADDEMANIHKFLLARHTPFRGNTGELKPPQPGPAVAVAAANRPPVPPPPARPPVVPPPPARPPVVPPPPPVPTAAVSTERGAAVTVADRPAAKPLKRCRHCQSEALRVLFGRNYYLKCSDCEQNTPINYVCASCGKEARIRKERERFFRECGACQASELYHVNEA